MSDSKYDRAEREHREPPDSPEGDFDQCEVCEGSGIYPQLMPGEPEKCEECDGDGWIFTPKLTREEYAEKYEDYDDE